MVPQNTSHPTGTFFSSICSMIQHDLHCFKNKLAIKTIFIFFLVVEQYIYFEISNPGRNFNHQMEIK